MNEIMLLLFHALDDNVKSTKTKKTIYEEIVPALCEQDPTTAGELVSADETYAKVYYEFIGESYESDETDE